MKRIFRLALAAALLFCAAIVAFAQNNQQNSGAKGQANSSSRPDYFVTTIYLNKVYTDNLGYMVVYADSSSHYQEAYLPMQWFNTAGGKGVLVYGSDRNYPYMDVYYQGGQFDHVVLYVKSDMSDPSWGVLPQTPGVADKFKVDTLKINY